MADQIITVWQVNVMLVLVMIMWFALLHVNAVLDWT
jgi:hypothetical protein